MIVESKGNKTEGTLSLKTGQSSISQDKIHKIIRLLSSQYSDPIGSMLREYTSNIHDSYIGTDKDPHGIVSLWKDDDKNQWYLSFKDNGSGLSPQMFEDIFIVYGESTKDLSNSAIGGYGLGSKTAFAYTDSLMIITRFEGQQYTYYYYKGDKGVPQYDLLSTVPTTDENGTEIRVPIKDVDVYRVRESRRQLLYFDNIYLEGFDYDNDYKLVDGKYFKYKQSSTLDLHVCLEKVYYPLPNEFFEYVNKKLNIDNKGWGSYNSIKNLQVAIKCNNGELKPTISRENFEYNDEVKDLLFDKLVNVIDELKDNYIKNNIINFDENYSLIDYFKLDTDNITFDFSGVKLRVQNYILNIEYSHKLLNKYNVSKSELEESFTVRNELSNNNSIISVNKWISLFQFNENYYIKDANISTRGVKAAYIRENLYGFKAIQVKKPSLNFYKSTLYLHQYPKDTWRDRIIAYQRCIDNVVSQLDTYSNIEPTEEFKEEYKLRQQVKKTKVDGEIKYSFIGETKYNEYKTNERVVVDLIKAYKQTCFIYGEKKHKEQLEEINNYVQNSLNKNYRCIYIRKKDLEFVENRKKFIHVEDINKIENIKILRNAVKAYQVHLLRRNTKYKIDLLQGINDDIYDKYKKIITFDDAYRSYSDKSYLAKVLYESHPEYRDTELIQFSNILDKYFDNIKLINYLHDDNSFEFKKALLEYLMTNKKKVNKEFYIKLNENEKEWVQQWKKENEYFLENSNSYADKHDIARQNKININEIELTNE